MPYKSLIGGFAALATAAALLASPDTARAGRVDDGASFRVDTVHSAIHFEIAHLGVSHAWGRFNDFQGSFVLDDAEPANSKVSITVMAESVDTANEKRDQHLRSADFFSSKQFPEMTFESSSVRPGGDGKYKVTGDLTFVGKTQEVSFEAVKVGEGETVQGYKAGFNATLVIDRMAFGVDTYPDTLGKDVILHVSLEGLRQ